MHLNAIVVHNGGRPPVRALVQVGPVDCCGAAPSGGFTYTGTTTFAVQAGDTYGFTFGGSNCDSEPQFNGTLTVPTTAYIDAAVVAARTPRGRRPRC